MRQLNRKLRSRKGASISFGLLLFLVCTVLASAIIVSSTAAAGRVSALTENDQRYYSVTSAAEMVEDMLGTEPVTIVKVKDQSRTIHYDDDGKQTSVDIWTDVPNSSATYLAQGKVNNIDDFNSESAKKIKISDTTAAKDVCAAFDSEAKLTAYVAFQYLSETPEFTLNLTPQKNTSLKSVLYGTVSSDGSLDITISSDGTQNYRLKMTFDADKKSSTDTSIVSTPDGDSMEVKEVKTIYDKTTMSWKLTDLKTVK